MGWTSRRFCAALGLTLAACGHEDVAAPRAPRGETPVPAPASPGLALSSPVPMARASSAVGGEVVYVATVPGTQPNAVQASITNVSTGARAPAAAVDGGFDPVALPASEGDSIRVVLHDSMGTAMHLLGAVFRPAPPRVVRTSPRGGRTDVPLNSRIQVIFSAPMDASSVTRSVHLERAGTAVAGEVRPIANGLAVEFLPTEALAPQADYELRIDADARDVLGQAMGSEARLLFRTSASSDSSAIPGADTTGAIPGADTTAVQYQLLRVYPSRHNVPGWNNPILGEFWQPRALFVGDTLWLAANGAGVQGYQDAIRAQWQSSAPAVMRVAVSADFTEGIAVAVAPGDVELRASAGGATGVWRTRVFESMPSSMMASVRLYVARDGSVHRQRADGTDASPLYSSVSGFSFYRVDWWGYLKYFPGFHDWRLASVSGAGEVATIYGGISIIRSGGDVDTLATLQDVWCPTWSPDGRNIAFTSQGVPYTEYDALMVVNVDSAVTHRLAWPGGWLPNCPIWDLDGSRLIVTSPENEAGRWPFAGKMVTYAVPLDGSPRIRLFEGVMAGPLSPDGQSMLVVDADGDLHRATSGGALLQRIAGVSKISPVAWSADGALVAMPFYVMSADGRYARNADDEILGFAP